MIQIHVGGAEKLRDEAIHVLFLLLKFKFQYAKDRSNVRCVVYEDQVHTFQVFGEEKGKESMQEIAEFVGNSEKFKMGIFYN